MGAPAYWLHTWLRQYGLALVGVTAAGLTRYGLDVTLGFTQPFILFYPIIMLTGLLCGFGPAPFATVLSGAIAGHFFLEPLNSFAVRQPRDVVGLALFGVMGITMSWLGDPFRRRAKRLQELEKTVEGLEEMIAVVDRDLSLGDREPCLSEPSGDEERGVGRPPDFGSIEPGSL